MRDNYHHGNLKEALIEAGIKLINKSGESSLSLRKVASLCDVSHAAPYAHFKDKDELISAIKETVTNSFMRELNEAINSSSSAEESIINMGKKYIMFFINRPDYFKFLFGSLNIVAHLKVDKDYNNDYPPFILLKNQYLKYLEENNIKRTNEEIELDLLRIWSTVHGLASIACISSVEIPFNIEEKLDILLK